MISSYIVLVLGDLKFSVPVGIIFYAAFLLVMYASKKRRGFSWRCMAELAFCIYGISLLKLVGIFSMNYSICRIKNYNLIPFVGSSFVPVFLNFLLFFPLGFLLPLVFPSRKWNWKKVLCTGAATSLCIEVLQLFGGRYAETDDVLINTLGALTGYLIYSFILLFRKKRKKALISLPR